MCESKCVPAIFEFTADGDIQLLDGKVRIDGTFTAKLLAAGVPVSAEDPLIEALVFQLFSVVLSAFFSFSLFVQLLGRRLEGRSNDMIRYGFD